MGDLGRYAAVNARARSLLPSLLGRSQLEQLCDYPDVDAVREALMRTPYAAGLLDHRPLESGITARLPAIGRALLRLLEGREHAFLRDCLLLHEVENLGLVIRAVHNGLGWEAIAPYVVPLGDIATLDVRSLAGAPDLQHIADRLNGTRYGQAVRGALHRVEAAGAFAVEVALEIDAYERLWATASGLGGVDATRARALLGILLDILNLGWIARYRDALGLSPEEILNYTLRPGRWLTLDIRRRLAEAPRRTWEAPLLRTPYAARLVEAERDGFDAASPALWAYLAAEIRRALEGDPFHVGVPLGLLLAQEIELRDLRTVLAAKRMHVPAAETVRKLVAVRV